MLGSASVTLKIVQFPQVMSYSSHDLSVCINIVDHARTVEVVGIDEAKLKAQTRKMKVAIIEYFEWAVRRELTFILYSCDPV